MEKLAPLDPVATKTTIHKTFSQVEFLEEIQQPFQVFIKGIKGCHRTRQVVARSMQYMQHSRDQKRHSE